MHLKKLIGHKQAKWLIIAIFVCLVSLGLVRWCIVLGSEDMIFRDIDAIPERSVGIVLGARVFSDGRVSDVLADRLEWARRAYEKKKFRVFLLSGDNSTAHYNEVEAMKQYLIRKWVDEHAIVLDYAGFDTYDTMYRARDIFGVKDAIIFTQDFHLNRSVYTARVLGLDVSGYPTDFRPYVGMRYLRVREIFSSFKAFLDVDILHSRPKYLGKKENSLIVQ